MEPSNESGANYGNVESVDSSQSNMDQTGFTPTAGTQQERRRRRRNKTQTSTSAQEEQTVVQQPEEQPPPRTRRVRTRTHQSVSMKSPAGDEQILLQPSDFGIISESDLIETLDIGTTTRPASAHDEGNMVTTTDQISVVVVQDKGKFRQATKQELDIAKPVRKEYQVESKFEENEDRKISVLIKKVQVYSLAIAYLSYGTLSGLGLCTLLLYPSKLTTVITDLKLPTLIQYSSSDFIVSFEYFSHNSTILSNTFYILLVIVAVHALETRQNVIQAATKVEHINSASDNQKPSRGGNGKQKKRRLISVLLVIVALIAFICNAIIRPIDQKWLDSVDRTDSGFSYGGYNFKIGPYGSYAAINLPQSSDNLLPWFWYYVAKVVNEQKSIELPASISIDLLMWKLLAIIRGICCMLCFVFALLEIRFRAISKKKATVS